jgi:hypothetical protein
MLEPAIELCDALRALCPLAKIKPAKPLEYAPWSALRASSQ